ncbi:hypothetical protein [Nocardia sp. SYP-A9097]|uniref:hypothetical protein n=1 Tax=Nocardia sp. SYP-A9097 TaxID=2663237 RepID=UPI00129B0DF5|nr:hypothetical protein [Nocardia sp. SYP-A9097]
MVRDSGFTCLWDGGEVWPYLAELSAPGSANAGVEWCGPGAYRERPDFPRGVVRFTAQARPEDVLGDPQVAGFEALLREVAAAMQVDPLSLPFANYVDEPPHP